MQKIVNLLLQTVLRIFFKSILKDEKDPYLTKIINLYKKDGFISIFAKIRIWDTPFIEVEKLISKRGLILDLGSGDGIFSNYLAVKSSQRKIIGIELNKERIKDAQKGLPNTKFIKGNALKAKLPAANEVLMYHLLHHLPTKKDQEKLILKCSEILNRNGKMIIVEVDKKPFFKFLFAHITDKILVPILFENKFLDLKINYRDRFEWKSLFESYSWKVRVINVHKDRPYSHIILYCYR